MLKPQSNKKNPTFLLQSFSKPTAMHYECIIYVALLKSPNGRDVTKRAIIDVNPIVSGQT